MSALNAKREIKMSYILGFTGYAGAGKDTLAEMVAGELKKSGYEVEVLSFADPIHAISAHLGFSPFVRETKEIYSEVMFPDFEQALMEAIEYNLSGLVYDDDLAMMFAYTLEELREQGNLCGDTLTISPRRLLQIIGTEGGRAVRDSFWEEVLLSQTEVDADEIIPSAFLVTDVRFPNEAEIPNRLVYVGRDDVAPLAEHESERHIKSIAENVAHDAVSNNGTLEELSLCARDLATSIIVEGFKDD